MATKAEKKFSAAELKRAEAQLEAQKKTKKANKKRTKGHKPGVKDYAILTAVASGVVLTVKGVTFLVEEGAKIGINAVKK